jgi:hypothetical protein
MICFRLGIIDFWMLRVSVERHLDSAMRLSLGTFENTIVVPHAYGHGVCFSVSFVASGFDGWWKLVVRKLPFLLPSMTTTIDLLTS